MMEFVAHFEQGVFKETSSFFSLEQLLGFCICDIVSSVFGLFCNRIKTVFGEFDKFVLPSAKSGTSSTLQKNW